MNARSGQGAPPMPPPPLATSRLNVTVRHLRAFVTIARLGSFVEAARALHVTQAALSNVMRELETSVEFRLLDRTTRRVRLSAAGAQYLPYAEKVLAALHDAERCAHDIRQHRAGVVRIATSRLVGWSLMAQVFARFHRLHPGVRVLPVDVLIEDIRAAVETGQADLAIATARANAAHDALEGVPLFGSRIHAVLAPDHPLVARSRLTWADLVDQPLIFVGRYPLLHLQLELGARFAPQDVHEVGDTTAALALVAAGIGIAISPGFVRAATVVHQLQVRAIEGPVIERAYSLYTHRGRTPLPVAEALRDFLIDYFAVAAGCCVEDPALGLVA